MKTAYLPIVAAAFLATSSNIHAAFHVLDIQEVYSNSDGSVQFVELFTLSNGQSALSGHTLTYEIGAAIQQTFNFSNLGSSTTAGKTVLIGTANLGTLYGVVPDFVIPANFFAQGSNNFINFAEGTDRVNLTNLPTDGTMSLNGLTGNTGQTAGNTSLNAQATPENFGGDTAVIPEPTAATMGLLALCAIAFRRNRA